MYLFTPFKSARPCNAVTSAQSYPGIFSTAYCRCTRSLHIFKTTDHPINVIALTSKPITRTANTSTAFAASSSI